MQKPSCENALLVLQYRRKFYQGENMKKDLFIKGNIWKVVKEYLLITFGAWIVATTLYFFMFPSGAVIGSASALAVVLSNFIPLSVSALHLILNVVLLIIGFLLIGSEFGIKTVYTSVIVPVFTGIYEVLLPDFQSLTGDPLLDVICHILVIGVGMAILFSCNASSGGLDIVAKIM